MMIKKMFYFTALSGIMLFTSCEKDETTTINPGENSGKLSIEITDAPIDQPNVTAAMITIADLKIDGQSVAGFQKITLNLLDLQNGITQALGNITLPEKSYEKITLELDHETDAEGNQPGSYVQFNDSLKQALPSSYTSIEAAYNFDIQTDSTTTLVLDFDLRKSIQHKTIDDSTSQIAWTDAINFNDALRIVEKATASTITGNCDKGIVSDDQIVALVYTKGEFNQDVESKKAENGIRFSNAITSNLVATDGNYEIHYLNPGNYEVHFASYSVDTETQALEFKGLLDVNTMGIVDLNDISLTANSETTIDITVTGLLGL